MLGTKIYVCTLCYVLHSSKNAQWQPVKSRVTAFHKCDQNRHLYTQLIIGFALESDPLGLRPIHFGELVQPLPAATTAPS